MRLKEGLVAPVRLRSPADAGFFRVDVDQPTSHATYFTIGKVWKHHAQDVPLGESCGVRKQDDLALSQSHCCILCRSLPFTENLAMKTYTLRLEFAHDIVRGVG